MHASRISGAKGKQRASAYASAMLPANVTTTTTKAIRSVNIPECGARDKPGRFNLRRRQDTANCDAVRHDSMAVDGTHQRELE